MGTLIKFYGLNDDTEATVKTSLEYFVVVAVLTAYPATAKWRHCEYNIAAWRIKKKESHDAVHGKLNHLEKNRSPTYEITINFHVYQIFIFTWNQWFPFPYYCQLKFLSLKEQKVTFPLARRFLICFDLTLNPQNASFCKIRLRSLSFVPVNLNRIYVERLFFSLSFKICDLTKWIMMNFKPW